MNARPFAVVFAAAWLLLPGLPPHAQTAAGFADRTSVVVVEVPVQVIRGGDPVRGLTQDDFEVREGGKKVPIVGFDVVDLERWGVEDGDASAAAPTPALPAAARRHFLFLFDLSFSRPDSVERARQAAYDLAAEGLHPADLAAVASYSSVEGFKVILGFTPDRDQLQLGLDSLGPASPFESFNDPLGIVLGELDPAVSSLREGRFIPNSDADRGRGPRPSGVDTAAFLTANALDLEQLGRRTQRDQQQHRILNMTAAMKDMAQLMGSVAGRVDVVLLSEGFDSSILLGNEGRTVEDQARLGEISDATLTGQFWRVDTDERFGSAVTQGGLGSMLRELQKAGTAVQAVDIGGVRAGADLGNLGERDTVGQNGLFIMANETGGELYRNYNNLSAAMGEMLERTSVTYLLALQPEDVELDGTFHRIDVKLKKSAGKARLVHRPGYYAPRPFADREQRVKQLETAALLIGGAVGGEIDTAVLTAPFGGGDGNKARVPVLIEVDGESLLQGAGMGHLPAELFAYAFDADGSVRGFFSHSLDFDLSRTVMSLRLGGFKFWGEMDLPAGDYKLRVLVRNSHSGAFGLTTAEVHVPTTGEATLLPPLFPVADDRQWVLGRGGGGAPGVDHPFVLRDRVMVPSARPLLEGREPVEVALVGYGLEGDGIAVEGRLTNAAGKPIDGGELSLVERLPSAVEGEVRLVAAFAPRGLRAGHYTLHVSVVDGAGQRGTSTIPIVVGG